MNATEAKSEYSAASELALVLRGVSKNFGRSVVIDRLDLELSRGETLAVIGKNGAGKTTLVRQIVGLLKPTSGAVLVRCGDAFMPPHKLRGHVAYQPQAQIALESLTPREAISLAGTLRGFSRRASQQRAEDLIEELDISPWAKTPGHRLSGGLRRLVAFGMTLNYDGPLVVLDEPTNDVDPDRRGLMWRALSSRAQMAAIVVTHNVHEAMAKADRVVSLSKGRLESATAESLGDAEPGASTQSVIVGSGEGPAHVTPVSDPYPNEA